MTHSLNTLCSPDEQTDADADVHKHKCSCGTCWKHNGDDCQVSHSAFVEGHTCPSCGNRVQEKHFSPAEEKQRREFFKKNPFLAELHDLMKELANQ